MLESQGRQMGPNRSGVKVPGIKTLAGVKVLGVKVLASAKVLGVKALAGVKDYRGVT